MRVLLGAWFTLPRLGTEHFSSLMKQGVKYDRALGFKIDAATDVGAALRTISAALGEERGAGPQMLPLREGMHARAAHTRGVRQEQGLADLPLRRALVRSPTPSTSTRRPSPKPSSVERYPALARVERPPVLQEALQRGRVGVGVVHPEYPYPVEPLLGEEPELHQEVEVERDR